MISCPVCGFPTSVRETRSEAHHVRRRRVCDRTDCNHRISTIEVVVDATGRKRIPHDVTMIVKSDLEMILKLAAKAMIGRFGVRSIEEAVARIDELVDDVDDGAPNGATPHEPVSLKR